jgi:hypothetical protein
MNRPVFYDISTESILSKDNLPREVGIDRAIDYLISLIRSNQIWFPFQRYFRGDPYELFNNLKRIELTVINKSYKLHSYYPQFGSYLPPKFRDTPTIVDGIKGTYTTGDVLSDFFIEEIRLKAKRYDQEKSVLECWNDDLCVREILRHTLKKPQITPITLRESMYEIIPETKIFKPTWAKALIHLVIGNDVAGKKWLDISAGWGDRLITAMSLDMDYIGYDPNIELRNGHSEMITMFGNKDRHRVVYEPFEKANIPPGPYDVVLSSPPYFTIEEYAPGQEGQSIVSFPDYDRWMVWFLYASLIKAWDNIKEGGYLILHLGDARSIVTTEPTNIFIENHLVGSSWEGIIGLQSETGVPRPVWVWKKLARSEKRNIWEPQITIQGIQKKYSERTLFNTYPELQIELLRFYADKYTHNYYHQSRYWVDRIRDEIIDALSHLPRNTLYDILRDDLLIFTVSGSFSPVNARKYFIEKIASDPSITFESLANSEEIPDSYHIMKESAENLRLHLSVNFPHINRDDIDRLLGDDLMISCLLDVLQIEKTITWSVAMMKFALRL